MDSRATYGEARFYMRWMKAVTPSSLAGAMAVHVDVAARFIWVAADIYGILEDTGIGLDGTGDVEPLYRYKPLPPGPTIRERGPLPERSTPGCYELAPVRGLPIRMVDDDRKRASTPGERHKMVMRQRRFEEQQQAKMAAAEATRRRRQALASGSHRDRLKLLREGGRR